MNLDVVDSTALGGAIAQENCLLGLRAVSKRRNNGSELFKKNEARNSQALHGGFHQ